MWLLMFVGSSVCLLSPALAQYSYNKKLTILTSEYSPYAVKAANGSISGLIPELLDAMAAADGFEYELKLQPDRLFGSLQPDGSFNGAVGALVAGLADVVAGDLTITPDRERVVDYITPFNAEITGICVRVNPVSGPIQYYVRKDSNNEDYLKNSASPRAKEIWANIQAGNGFIPSNFNDEGIAMVLSTTANNAYIEDRNNLVIPLKSQPEARFSGEILKISLGAFAVRPENATSPNKLRDRLSRATEKVLESGQLQKLYVKYGLG